MPTPDLLQVKFGEDTWQISESGENKFLLYHNNYLMVHLEARKAQQVAEAALTAMAETEPKKGEKDIDSKEQKKSMWRRLFEKIRKINF